MLNGTTARHERTSRTFSDCTTAPQGRILRLLSARPFYRDHPTHNASNLSRPPARLLDIS